MGRGGGLYKQVTNIQAFVQPVKPEILPATNSLSVAKRKGESKMLSPFRACGLSRSAPRVDGLVPDQKAGHCSRVHRPGRDGSRAGSCSPVVRHCH